MAEDLMKRLRGGIVVTEMLMHDGHTMDLRLTAELMAEGADRIAALERQLEAARQIEANVQAAREAEFKRAEGLKARLEEAEADAARLAGVLHAAGEYMAFNYTMGCEPLVRAADASVTAHRARMEKNDG